MKQSNIFTPINYLFHALIFWTRIPVSKYVDFDKQILFRSRVLGPIVGLIIGGSGAIVFSIFQNHLGKDISILLAILITIILTGGLHEDGLADSIDAFGGGHSKKDTLNIMKDSRIGTFGSLALIFAFTITFVSLIQLPAFVIPSILIFAHVTSRLATLPLMLFLTYVRHDTDFEKIMQEKSKYIDIKGVILISIFTLTLSLWFFDFQGMWFLILTFLVSFLSGSYYKHHIGGMTGDCYGATIKITEIACYILAVFIYKI